MGPPNKSAGLVAAGQVTAWGEGRRPARLAAGSCGILLLLLILDSTYADAPARPSTETFSCIPGHAYIRTPPGSR
jgi:hypothetical protein